MLQQRSELVRRVHPVVLHHARVARVGRGAEAVELFLPDRQPGHTGVPAPRYRPCDPARPQHPMHLAQRRARIGNVEQHEREQGSVESLRAERKMLRVGDDAGQIARAASDLQHAFGPVGADQPGVRRGGLQRRNQHPRAAAQVEDSRNVGERHAAQHRLRHRTDHRRPVLRIGLGDRRVFGGQLRQRARASRVARHAEHHEAILSLRRSSIAAGDAAARASTAFRAVPVWLVRH